MADNLQRLIWMAEIDLRRTTTAIAVKSGHACPEPDCGLYYRHTHDGLWWPPDGTSPPVSREATERWFRDREQARRSADG